MIDRRIERSVTNHANPTKSYTRKFIYDGDHILAVLDGSNNLLAAYLHGQGVDEPMAIVTDSDNNGKLDVLSLIRDHQNSVRFVTNESQFAVQSIRYTAYGEPLIMDRAQTMPKTENMFYYTGRELEPETGDYYYRARYYDSGTGRFLSEDPIGFKGGNLNIYSYVSGRPVIKRDPSGMKNLPEHDLPLDPVPVNPRDASDEALDAFPDKNERGNRDAYRHCLASCYTASRYGKEIAEILGDINEAVGINSEEQHKQDYSNNNCGFNVSTPGGSQFSCQNNCLELLKNGQLETRYP